MAGILERRHPIRRALCGGVVLGAAAGLAVGLVETIYVLFTAGASFDGVIETGGFVLLTTLTLAGAGALIGAAQGLVAAAVGEAATALGDPRRDGLWQARLYTALAVPPVALGCAQIFRGPRARTIAHHDLYALAIGAGALVLLFAAIRTWQRLYDDRLARRAAFALAAGCALAALGCYLANQLVLVRLYPFFHVGLGLGAFAGAQLAIAMASLGAQRRLARLLRPGAALAIGCLALALGALSLVAMGRQRALRSVVLERTALLAPILRVSGRAQSAPREQAVAEVQGAPLPEGPHLGPVDVFLITVDAMRADRLTPRTAPNLAALAQSGVVFDRAYAQVPHTSFSIATLLTGKYVYALSTLGLDAASHQTLAEIMKRERYKTAAFYPPAVFTIDHERLKAMEQGAYGFEYVKYEFMDAARRTDQVIHFLESERPEHAFVWVHYFEPHEPYEAHPGHFDGARQAIDRYDGEVHYVDGEVARLIAYLRATRPRSIVILAADHGEEFGEHGGRYHGTTLYEEQVHVPLALVPLDGAGLSAHHVETPVGLVDVVPTILALIGITPSAKMRGRDLGPWLLPPAQMAPADAHGPVFGEINQQKMVIDGSHKLTCDLGSDACSAFDLRADPGERKNRLDDPFAAQLRARLDAFIAEESRFESTGAEADAKSRRLLERARQGDKTVARELVPLVADEALRPDVVRLLATLPPEPAARAALGAVRDEALRPWADLALARLGDKEAQQRLRPLLVRDCADGKGPAEFCARAALALGDVDWLGQLLERADLDEALQLQIIAALGRSRDPRALDPLMLALAQVRTRADTVSALAQLDDVRALPTLLRWLPAEPYVPVRARMVPLVAQLGRHTPDEARAVLTELATVEREAPVMAALLPALRSLGAPAVVELARGPAHAVAAGELWIVGSGAGALDITVGGGLSRATLADGVARAETPRAGVATIRRRDGDAAPRLAFSRPTP